MGAERNPMFFQNEYEFLSNFHVDQDGSTVEHHYQAAKATNPVEYNLIRQAPTAGKAKRLGRTIQCRADWEIIKYDVMRSLVMFKFLSDPVLGAKLCKVVEDIEETNMHHDNIWGNCVCENCKDVEATNWLGEILMDVRTHIKNLKPVVFEDAIDINNL